jgi:hypothetical protein
MINDRSLFNAIMETLNSAVSVSSEFPERVFRPGYRRFYFFEFDRTFSEMFWGVIQKIALESLDSRINVVSIDPAPVEYFFKEFGEFGAVQVKATATADEYYETLCTHPPSHKLDSLFHSETLAWFPDSVRWLVWGERGYGIAVLGLDENFDPPINRFAQDEEMPLLTLEEALSEIVSLNFRDPTAFEAFSRKFKTNYLG